MENYSHYPVARQLKVPAREEVSRNNYIYRYNHERMKEKGLIPKRTESVGTSGAYTLECPEDAAREMLSEKYLCLQALYRANLDAYISETLDLESLDTLLKNSELGFRSSKPGEKNLYERESTMGFEFLYLRNNLYIENLDREQLRRLEEHLKTGDAAVTDEMKTMAAETCREVIRVREPGNWDDTDSFLYPAELGTEPEIPRQALVLAITNNAEYDEAGNFLPGDNMRQKYEYLEKIKAEKEKEYTRILGMCVYIFIPVMGTS